MWDKAAPVAFLVGVYGFFLWVVALSLRQPERFFELFVRRQNRWWGIEAAIADESKFKRRMRLFGWVMLAFTVLHAALVFSAILREK